MRVLSCARVLASFEPNSIPLGSTESPKLMVNPSIGSEKGPEKREQQGKKSPRRGGSTFIQSWVRKCFLNTQCCGSRVRTQCSLAMVTFKNQRRKQARQWDITHRCNLGLDNGKEWAFWESRKWSVSYSVASDSLPPMDCKPTRLLCPWDSPGKNSGVSCHSLPQGIFLTQGLSLHLLHCRQILSGSLRRG